MLKRIWLVFAQAVAPGLGVWMGVSFMQKDEGPVRGPVQVMALKESAQPAGNTIAVTLLREGREQVVNVRVGKRPPVRRAG